MNKLINILVVSNNKFVELVNDNTKNFNLVKYFSLVFLKNEIENINEIKQALVNHGNTFFFHVFYNEYKSRNTYMNKFRILNSNEIKFINLSYGENFFNSLKYSAVYIHIFTIRCA